MKTRTTRQILTAFYRQWLRESKDDDSWVTNDGLCALVEDWAGTQRDWYEGMDDALTELLAADFVKAGLNERFPFNEGFHDFHNDMTTCEGHYNLCRFDWCYTQSKRRDK